MRPEHPGARSHSTRRCRMRTRFMLALLAVGACLAATRPRRTLAAPATRHDGAVETVNVTTRRLVIREFGAGARPTDLSVHVAADARIVVSRRNEHATDSQHPFVDTPVQLADVKRGDFVVVDVMGHGRD